MLCRRRKHMVRTRGCGAMAGATAWEWKEQVPWLCGDSPGDAPDLTDQLCDGTTSSLCASMACPAHPRSLGGTPGGLRKCLAFGLGSGTGPLGWGSPMNHHTPGKGSGYLGVSRSSSQCGCLSPFSFSGSTVRSPPTSSPWERPQTVMSLPSAHLPGRTACSISSTICRVTF